MKEQLIKAVGGFKRKGIFDVIGAGLINKALVFFTTVLLIRILSKETYGLFSYAYNNINIVMIFSSLGMSSVMLQFASEQQIKEKRLYVDKFCVIIGVLSNCLFVLGIFIFSFFAPEKIEGANSVFRQFSFIIIVQFIFSSIVSFFRTELDNRKYRMVTNINSLFYFLGACIGAYFFSITGTIVGRYIGFIVATLVGLYLMRNDKTNMLGSRRFDGFEPKTLLSYGFTILLTNAVSQVLYTVDVLVVGNVIGTSTAVADYKTATTIPFALAFIPQLIVTYIYPHFARNREKFDWIWNKTCIIVGGLGLINIIITVGGFVFAPFIIRIFGDDYQEIVPCFRILMISYFFSGTFRVIIGNILAMLRKVKVNLVLGIIESTINVILDVCFIYWWGSIGAAIATTSITVLSSVASVIYLVYYLKTNINRNN